VHGHRAAIRQADAEVERVVKHRRPVVHRPAKPGGPGTAATRCRGAIRSEARRATVRSCQPGVPRTVDVDVEDRVVVVERDRARVTRAGVRPGERVRRRRGVDVSLQFGVRLRMFPLLSKVAQLLCVSAARARVAAGPTNATAVSTAATPTRRAMMPTCMSVPSGWFETRSRPEDKETVLALSTAWRQE
jgi:hypothetical protein